ncbi:hypothetical protein L083_4346 [Actinoplanes sp. N902-109]|nr:hypothetical protein L083_4346 [Actinoplanes sp. N902-109]
MRWGETVDNVASYPYLDRDDLVIGPWRGFRRQDPGGRVRGRPRRSR